VEAGTNHPTGNGHRKISDYQGCVSDYQGCVTGYERNPSGLKIGLQEQNVFAPKAASNLRINEYTP
jgi:hypothetical protein